MDTTEYILIAVGQADGQMHPNALMSKLQDYGVSETKAEAGIKECLRKSFLVLSGDTYKLTRTGAGMYRVALFYAPAWPYNDVRSVKK